MLLARKGSIWADNRLFEFDFVQGHELFPHHVINSRSQSHVLFCFHYRINKVPHRGDTLLRCVMSLRTRASTFREWKQKREPKKKTEDFKEIEG